MPREHQDLETGNAEVPTDRSHQSSEIRSLSRRVSSVQGAEHALIGSSQAMLNLRARLERVAQSPSSTVLLTGESGVGKDAAARYLHTCSARAAGPFVNVTCSALPEALLESELFGYERGAFTDAKARKLGLLEVASGGTVLLDEIGEMSPLLQAKLLRVLEEGRFRRIGGAVDLHPDVRVLAATNRDLPQEVAIGNFREDLYYRLSVLHVHVPPLRERESDVVLLARHFLARYAALFGREISGFSPEAEQRLEQHRWPGNVRELKNTLERAALMSDGRVIGVEDLEFDVASDAPRASRWLELPPDGIKLEALERDLVEQALLRTQGNKTRAAALLGLTRDQLRHRVEKFDLGRTGRR